MPGLTAIAGPKGCRKSNASDAIVRDQLDELMPQFQEEHPAFYHAYFAARVVVSQRGRQKKKDEKAADGTAKKAA